MLHREAHNVRVGAGNAFDNQIAFFLNGVSAGFVERIYLGEVAADCHRVQRAKAWLEQAEKWYQANRANLPQQWSWNNLYELQVLLREAEQLIPLGTPKQEKAGD